MHRSTYKEESKYLGSKFVSLILAAIAFSILPLAVSADGPVTADGATIIRGQPFTLAGPRTPHRDQGPRSPSPNTVMPGPGSQSGTLTPLISNGQAFGVWFSNGGATLDAAGGASGEAYAKYYLDGAFKHQSDPCGTSSSCTTWTHQFTTVSGDLGFTMAFATMYWVPDGTANGQASLEYRFSF